MSTKQTAWSNFTRYLKELAKTPNEKQVIYSGKLEDWQAQQRNARQMFDDDVKAHTGVDPMTRHQTLIASMPENEMAVKPSPDKYVPHPVVADVDVGDGKHPFLVLKTEHHIVSQFEILRTIYVIASDASAAVKVARLVLQCAIPDIYGDSRQAVLAWTMNYPSFTDKKYSPFAVHVGRDMHDIYAVKITLD